MKLLRITPGMTAIGLLLLISGQAIAYDEGLLRQRLKNVSAMKAVAIANELKWESGSVKAMSQRTKWYLNFQMVN